MPANFKFVLPIKPVSVNELYGYRKGAKKPFLSQKGREFKLKAHELLVKQWGELPPLKCRVKTYLEFRYTDRIKRDVDNPIKATHDALTGLVIVDDEQIDEVTAKKVYSAPAEEIIMIVSPIAPTHEETRIEWDRETKRFKRLHDGEKVFLPSGRTGDHGERLGEWIKMPSVEEVKNAVASEVDNALQNLGLKKPKLEKTSICVTTHCGEVKRPGWDHCDNCLDEIDQISKELH
jgi:Holliday junction resolvase RusA-like endonuclease